MRVLGYGIVTVLIAWLLCFSVSSCVDVANAAGGSHWDTMYDKEHSVFCAVRLNGWGDPLDAISCVYVPRDTVR